MSNGKNRKRGEPMTRPLKVRENRLRGVAKRRGYLLQRKRRFDQQAIDFGLYRLVSDPDDTRTPYSLTLDEVERKLDEDSLALAG